MRLLRTSDLQFEDFPGTDRPPYAILSHTWGKEEVLYADVLRPRREETKKKTWNLFGKEAEQSKPEKAGWEKVRGCARIARARGLDYCWIDTCCIDKSSSTELSEAINSMYRWYREAATCLVYLSDVPSNDLLFLNDSKFGNSRWFARGWTLQELVAPVSLDFYDARWKKCGNRADLADMIEKFTSVSPLVYGRPDMLAAFPIDERKKWIAKRNTTRPEDLAYCLMGIFDISMSVIYGEGKDRAFRRLNEEIRKEEQLRMQDWAAHQAEEKRGSHLLTIEERWRDHNAQLRVEAEAEAEAKRCRSRYDAELKELEGVGAHLLAVAEAEEKAKRFKRYDDVYRHPVFGTRHPNAVAEISPESQPDLVIHTPPGFDIAKRQKDRKSISFSQEEADEEAQDARLHHRERAARDIAFERDYVLIEKKPVEVNAFADEVAKIANQTSGSKWESW